MEDEEKFAWGIETCADRFYLENFEKIDTDRESYLSALRSEMELIANAIAKVEPKRRGWRTKRNRQGWIEKYQRMSVAIFECRLVTLEIGRLAEKAEPQ